MHAHTNANPLHSHSQQAQDKAFKQKGFPNCEKPSRIELLRMQHICLIYIPQLFNYSPGSTNQLTFERMETQLITHGAP